MPAVSGCITEHILSERFFDLIQECPVFLKDRHIQGIQRNIRLVCRRIAGPVIRFLVLHCSHVTVELIIRDLIAQHGHCRKELSRYTDPVIPPVSVRIVCCTSIPVMLQRKINRREDLFWYFIILIKVCARCRIRFCKCVQIRICRSQICCRCIRSGADNRLDSRPDLLTVCI